MKIKLKNRNKDVFSENIVGVISKIYWKIGVGYAYHGNLELGAHVRINLCNVTCLGI